MCVSLDQNFYYILKIEKKKRKGRDKIWSVIVIFIRLMNLRTCPISKPWTKAQIECVQALSAQQVFGLIAEMSAHIEAEQDEVQPCLDLGPPYMSKDSMDKPSKQGLASAG